MMSLVPHLIWFFIGALVVVAIDWLWHRRIYSRLYPDSTQLRAEIVRLRSELEKARTSVQLEPQAVQPVKSNLEPLEDLVPRSSSDPFATSMPRVQTVVAGGPEFEALKQRIGEVMSHNIVLQSQLHAADADKAKIAELESNLARANELQQNLARTQQLADQRQQQLTETLQALYLLREDHRRISGERDDAHGKLARIEAYAQSMISPNQNSSLRGSEPATVNAYVPFPTRTTPIQTTSADLAHQPAKQDQSNPLVASPVDDATVRGQETFHRPTITADPTLASGQVLEWSPAGGPSFQAAVIDQPTDDFSKIPGLDQAHANALVRAGVTTYRQLAMTSPLRLREILRDQPWSSVDAESWIRQAARLEFGAR